jgi:prevent-host-death family protein
MPGDPIHARQIPLTRLRATIGTIVDEVRDGSPIVVMRRGEPTAVIMSYADFKGTLGVGARVRKAADLLALVDRARGPRETGDPTVEIIRRAREDRATRGHGTRKQRTGKVA